MDIDKSATLLPPLEPIKISEAKAHADSLLKHLGDEWESFVTFDGRAQVSKPGFEITCMWEDMYQCVIISSKYRMVGQGTKATYALAAAVSEMVKLRDELNFHIANV